MVRLRLACTIAAPIEEVYERVTAYGADGPTSEDAFREKYGKVVERDGNTIVTEEDVRGYPEDDPDLIRWRCTFDYPSDRTMEAIDSNWAHRRDTFRFDGDATLWRVQWNSRTGGLKGIAQYLFFRLAGHRRLRAETLDPVKQHFEEPESNEVHDQ